MVVFRINIQLLPLIRFYTKYSLSYTEEAQGRLILRTTVLVELSGYYYIKKNLGEIATDNL